MATFNKSDLHLTHYSWTTAPGDSKLAGEPDSSLFNRQEGYEVLYVLSKILEQMGSTSKTKLHKGEVLIEEKLPSSLREQSAVRDWIGARL